MANILYVKIKKKNHAICDHYVTILIIDFTIDNQKFTIDFTIDNHIYHRFLP